MRGEVINFQKWFNPVPLPSFCPKCLEAHVEMAATSVMKAGSRATGTVVPRSLPHVRHTTPGMPRT